MTDTPKRRRSAKQTAADTLREIASDPGASAILRVRAARSIMQSGTRRRKEDQADDGLSPLDRRSIEIAAGLGDMPAIGVHRGVRLHAFQPEDRLEAEVRPAIDAVFDMTSPTELLDYAGNCFMPPEARLLANARYRALHEAGAASHGLRENRIELITAATAGLTLRWMSPDRFCSDLDVPKFGAPGSAAPSRRPERERRRLLAAQGRADDC